MNDKEYKRLLNKAEAYTAKAERSPKEVITKLRLWSTDEPDDELISRIMQELTKNKFVDQDRYAEKFISDKVLLLHKGPLLLTQELTLKGIPKDIIREQLSEISREQWIESAESYLMPKLEGYRRKSRNSYELRMRLSRAAYGRGFGADIIDEVLSSLDLSVPNGEETDEYYE